MKLLQLLAAIAVALITQPASAADYPAPKEGSFVARDFRFHTGEVLPELRLHYRTVGEPSGEPGDQAVGSGADTVRRGTHGLQPRPTHRTGAIPLPYCY